MVLPAPGLPPAAPCTVPASAASLFLARESAAAYARNRVLDASAETRGAPPDSEAHVLGDPDTLHDLGEEICTLAAQIHAATERLLSLLAEFDRRGGWKAEGHRSSAHWLHFRTGIDLGAAREKVRVARALEALPETRAAMGRGELSFSKVRALTRVAKAATEGELLPLARELTAAELEKVVRGWGEVERGEEAEVERRRHGRRYLSVAPDGAGMYVVRGRLTPEVGAILMRAVEAASDALFRPGETWSGEGGPRGPVAEEVTPGQRRADALGLLAERALAAGFGPVPGVGDEAEEEGEGEGSRGCGCARAEPPLSGTRAERYQVVVHVDRDTLEAEGPGGRSHLEDGTRVSAETSRRLGCDAARVRVLRGRGGSVLDVGRKSRTVPPALRRALEVRDGGCRFPGCGLRFTEAHHILHWADGGETNLANLILLCRFHHRALHEEGFRVRMDPDGRRIRFFDRRGWPLPDSAPPPRLGAGPPLAALLRENRLRGVAPDGDTPESRWRCVDEVPLEVYGPAVEAILEGVG
jgi:hypothetical protein